MSRTPTILIVDDDPNLREIVRFALEKEGYPSVQAANGKLALAAYAAHKPALIVLDIMMPEMNGTDVCRELRKTSTTPIIFLSSRDDELDRIVGLELGGDDYLTKPFSPRELVARVKALLRRSEITAKAGQPAAPPEGETLAHGILRLDLTACKAFVRDSELTLTVIEFGILRTLMRRPTKVFNRDELMTLAYDDNTVVADRTIDSHIRRVRKKFGALGFDPIETVTGFGYKLAPKQT